MAARWSSVELATLLGSGMRPVEVRAVLAVGVGSLMEYGRLSGEECAELGVRHVSVREIDDASWCEVWVAQVGEAGYPTGLAEISAPPLVVYGMGARDVGAAAAVIGTREMTRIGERCAIAAVDGARLARENGIDAWVASGMAKGCDRAAHVAALEAGVPTVGVVACGLDVVREHTDEGLMERVLESGGTILSEQPFGTPTRAQGLMARNRIIVGMSDVVVPCEASSSSRGTLNAVGVAVAEERFIVTPRLKEQFRGLPGAWLSEQLASEQGGRWRQVGWPKRVLELADARAPLANAVAETAEDIAEFVAFALRFSAAGVAR